MLLTDSGEAVAVAVAVGTDKTAQGGTEEKASAPG